MNTIQREFEDYVYAVAREANMLPADVRTVLMAQMRLNGLVGVMPSDMYDKNVKNLTDSVSLDKLG